MALVCLDSTYGLERLSIDIFNRTMPTKPLDKWRMPNFCPSIGAVDNGRPKYFVQKLNSYYVAKFWSEKWGCDATSAFMRERRQNSEAGAAQAQVAAADRLAIPP